MEHLCTRFTVLWCFWLASFSMGNGQTPKQSTSSSTGVILVSVRVEGQIATFLLDTGAERSCIDRVFASRLKLRSTGAVDIREPYSTVTADSLHISDLEIQALHLQDVDMVSSDLARFSHGAGLPIDGVLGSDVLRHFIVRIDFLSGSALFRKTDAAPLRGAVVTLQSFHDLYFVSFTAHGVPISLLLDTGANASAVSAHAWGMIAANQHSQTMVSGVRSTGGSEDANFVLVREIHIGDVQSSDTPFRVQPMTSDGLFADAGFDGLLGSDVLRQYFVTLDLANNKMYLVANPKNHLNPYLFSTIGIQFARDEEGTYTIMAVWAPSPAQTAGLKVGDRLLAINQLDTQPMSLDDLSRQIHGRPGTKVRLVIASDGHRRDVPISTSCLLCPAGNHPRKPQ